VRRSLILSLVTMAALAAEDQPAATGTAPTANTPPAAQPVMPDETHESSSSLANSLGANLVLSAGYDSNAILEPTNDPTATDKSGAAFGVDATGKIRLVDQSGKGVWDEGDHGERLLASVDASYRDYPGVSQAEMLRGGVHLVGHERESWGDPGFVLGYNHYNIDHSSAADATNANIFASRIAKDFRNVNIATLGAEWLRYDVDPDKTGIYTTLGYSHWYMLESNNIHRRIEAGLAVDADKSRTRDESFVGLIPDIGGTWRYGAGQKLGTYDFVGSYTYEFRRYGSEDGTQEHQGISDLNASADAWLCNNATFGIYGDWTHRSSNFEANAYTRFQVGARLAANW